MRIANRDLDTEITLQHLYTARAAGCDIGDVAGGKLQGIAANLLDALDAAWLVYEPRLHAIEIATFEDFIKCEPAELKALVDEFRRHLVFFFPAMEMILAEVEQLTAPKTMAGE